MTNGTRQRNRRGPVAGICGAALMVALVPAGADAATTAVPAGRPAPIEVMSARTEVIVVLRPGTDVDAASSAVAAATAGQVGRRYYSALRGFSITVPSRAAAAIAARADVALVEPVRPVGIDAQTVPTGVRRIAADTNPAIDIDGNDDKRVDVDVAVIDTGIDLQHPDLHVVGGVNCVNQTATCVAGGDDDHYHGTHVAGSVAALDNGDGVVGVAPGARLHAVKVLNSQGSGTTAQVIAGIDWVASQAGVIEVANMSLGGAGYSTAEYTAIQGAVNKGVAFAVAAGNSTADAAGYSPAAFDNVLTVSALADFDGRPGGLGSPTCRTDVDETNADFSNYGAVVDLAAPGVCITSTYPVERGSLGTISGTSMASPHAAGGLALLASTGRATDAAGVRSLYSRLVAAGNQGWTDRSPDGVTEPLLDVASFAPRLVDTPATASITYTGSAVTVNKSTWRATVTVTSSAPVTVSGTWSAGTPSASGCSVTTAGGTCTFSDTLASRTRTVTWTSSDGVRVTVARP